MIPGVALFIMETFPPETGGVIFSKYDATKLYWLGLIAYSVISKLIHNKVERQRPPIPRAPLSKQLIYNSR
jgi:hypothetical protein